MRSACPRNLVGLDVYTADVDLLFPHYGVLASRLGAAGGGTVHPAIPTLMVELEGIAVA